MCGVWCVVCGVNLPFWLKFKWRMAHSRNRGTWNREPPPPLSIRGLVVYSISPIHLFLNSIPSLPPPLRATSPQYHTFHSPIHPHFHLCNLPASSTWPQHPTFHPPMLALRRRRRSPRRRLPGRRRRPLALARARPVARGRGSGGRGRAHLRNGCVASRGVDTQ